MSIRVCILGNSASGKSTIAKKLAESLSIPVFHLDKELLYDNFQRYSAEEQEAIHNKLLEKDSWIIEGDYKNLLPERAARATHIIFLDIGRLVTIPRIILRAKNSGQDTDVIPKGANPKSMSFELIKWVGKYKRKIRRKEYEDIARKQKAHFLAVSKGPIEKQLKQIAEFLISK